MRTSEHRLEGAVTGLLSAANAPAALAADPAAGVSMMDLVSVLGGLILVLAVFAGMVWAMKRAQSSRTVGSRHLEVVGGLSFGMRDRVVLVRAAQRHVLLAVGSQGIRALSEWEVPGDGEEFAGALGESRARLREGAK
jgi:flagellar protein FliO/FliZ